MLARPAVHVSVLAVVALVVCLARVATVPLDGDPAMYATIARTIAVTGEWTSLSFNGEPYFNKPPLHFWVNALVFRAFGATTFTAALAPGVLGAACVLLVYALARAGFGSWRVGLAAAVVYLTTPEVVHWSRGVHLETLVTFWILIGLWAAWRSVERPAAIPLLGLAALGGWFAKGPQGLYPIAVAAVLWLHDGVFRRRVLSPWTLVTAAVVGGVIGVWVAARIGEGTGFARAYFEEQIAHALTEAGELRRGRLWYFGKLVRTYWPWLPVAALGLAELVRRYRTSIAARLWLVYAALVMTVITLAVGRKSRYLFQLYPALAVAAGVALGAVAERRPRLPAALLGAAALVALAIATVGGERSSAKQALHARDALAIAAALPPGADVWLTNDVQYAEPQLGKIVGFYARPLLRTCVRDCAEEAVPGSLVVSRAGVARRVAMRLGGTVVHRTESLALVRVPVAPADGVLHAVGWTP